MREIKVKRDFDGVIVIVAWKDNSEHCQPNIFELNDKEAEFLHKALEMVVKQNSTKFDIYKINCACGEKVGVKEKTKAIVCSRCGKEIFV